jgi:hypothetical protein
VQLLREKELVGLGKVMEEMKVVHGRELKEGWIAICTEKIFKNNLSCWKEFPTHSGEIEEGSFSAWPKEEIRGNIS